MTDAGEFGRELAAAALAGADAEQLLREVAAAVGATCRLVTPAGALVAATDAGAGVGGTRMANGARVTATDGWVGVAVVLSVGGLARRVLLVDPAAGHDGAELAAAAGTALLIDDMRAAPVVPPLRPGQIVSALRKGRASPSVVAAAEAAGLLDGTPRSAAVLHYAGPRQRAWHTALAWLDHAVEPDGPDAWVLVRDAGQLRALRDSLCVTVGDDRVSAASGSAAPDAGGLPASFAEARRLLALAHRRGATVLGYEDAGLVQVLLATPRDRLEQYVAACLGPVLDKADLLQTLRAWLAESGSRRSVSEQLHLHRNSVGYRVRRLKDLLGVDPLEPAAAAGLQLALTAWDLLDAEDTAEDVAR